LNRLNFGENDRKWFPSWLLRFAKYLGAGRKQDLSFTTDQIIAFLVSIKKTEVPAWQRLQTTRAIEAHTVHHWKQPDTGLDYVKTKLGILAAQESRRAGRGIDANETPEDVIGVLDQNEPEVVRRMRSDLQRMRYKFDTEMAYIAWIKRFMAHCRSDDLEQFNNLAKGKSRTFLPAWSSTET
jgi:hypothetical protein